MFSPLKQFTRRVRNYFSENGKKVVSAARGVYHSTRKATHAAYGHIKQKVSDFAKYYASGLEEFVRHHSDLSEKMNRKLKGILESGQLQTLQGVRAHAAFRLLNCLESHYSELLTEELRNLISSAKTNLPVEDDGTDELNNFMTTLLLGVTCIFPTAGSITAIPLEELTGSPTPKTPMKGGAWSFPLLTIGHAIIIIALCSTSLAIPVLGPLFFFKCLWELDKSSPAYWLNERPLNYFERK